MEESDRSERPEIRPGSGHAGCPDGPSHLIRLVGPLDAFSARGIEEELAGLVVDHPRLTVDLCDVEVLTSGGLAMLERCRARAAGAGHSLWFRVRPGSIVQRVVEMGALPGLVAAVESRAAPAPRATGKA